MIREIPLVNRLRLYAMLMRLQELKAEIAMKAFLPEPIMIISNRELSNKRMYYDPNSYENQPSKFIGKPKNNFKKR